MKLQISLSATPILYHITGIKNAVSMAQKNRFELTPADGRDEEEKISAGQYYMSMTRHRLGGFTLNMMDRFSVILTLDGVKLSSRYKIRPVDYFNSEYDDEKDREAEDRLFYKNPVIEKANQYIKEIHAFRGVNKKDFDGSKGNQLITLSRYALKNKIAIYFYNDQKAFLLLNKSRAVPLDIQNLPRDKALTLDKYRTRDTTLEEYKSEHRSNHLTGWLQLYSIPQQTDYQRAYILWNQNPDIKDAFENLMDEPRKVEKQPGFTDGYLLHRRFESRVSRVKRAMAFSQTTKYGDISRAREDVDRLVKILRARKWSLQQFVIAMHDKWAKFMPEEWKKKEEEEA